MKNRVQKIVILTIIIFNFMLPYANAANPNMDTDIVGTGESWLDAGKKGGLYSSLGIETEVSKLAGLLFALGIAVAVIVIAILGIKFMTTAASEQKAEAKKKAIIVAVGMGVLLGALSIWGIIVGILSAAT